MIEYDPVHVFRFEYDVAVFRFCWITIEESLLLFREVTVAFSLTDAYVPVWDATPELLQRNTATSVTDGDLYAKTEKVPLTVFVRERESFTVIEIDCVPLPVRKSVVKDVPV